MNAGVLQRRAAQQQPSILQSMGRTSAGDGAPFNGPYGFSRHPWCREIHDSHRGVTIAMKAAQVGRHETGINRAFFTLDSQAGRALRPAHDL